MDWIDFTASTKDPIPEVHNRFSQCIFGEFEKHFGPDALKELDLNVFAEDRIFAVERGIANTVPADEMAETRTRLISKSMELQPKDFALARLRTLGMENRNAAVLIFDNVDHLPSSVFDSLIAFLIEVQKSTPFLVVVAVRDHSDKRFSTYDSSKIVPGWHMRLRAPNMQL